MPNPRLTGLGCGLFCGAAMVALAGLDRLLFGASLPLYGVLFLLVSALSAVWVRRGDLASAPVVVPIAFAAGLPLVAGGEGGFGGHLMALVTALAMQAGWLYGGTLVAGLIVTVRKVRLMARRAAEREREREREREWERERKGAGRLGQVRTPGVQARTPGVQARTPGVQARTPGAQGRAPGVQGRSPYDRGPVGPRAPRPPAQSSRTAPRGS